MAAVGQQSDRSTAAEERRFNNRIFYYNLERIHCLDIAKEFEAYVLQNNFIPHYPATYSHLNLPLHII